MSYPGRFRSDSDSVLGPDALAGTYALISANGATLPVILFEFEDEEFGSFSITLLSGSLTITPSGPAGGTWTAALVVEENDNGVVEVFDEGSTGPYTISGNTITLEDEEEPITGTVSGNQIILSLDGDELGTITLVFRK